MMIAVYDKGICARRYIVSCVSADVAEALWIDSRSNFRRIKLNKHIENALTIRKRYIGIPLPIKI